MTSAYDQTATCAWCGETITRAAHNKAAWVGETKSVTSCKHRDDGKYHHEPLEPGEPLKGAKETAKQPPCPHAPHRCAITWSNLSGLTHHMIAVHRYLDDEYGEDTAQSNAWRAYYEAGFDPPQY